MNIRINKTNTVFCDKIPYLKMNDLLTEIFNRASNFNRFNGYYADNILLKFEDLLRIRKERNDLISKKEDGEYILCLKILI